MAAFDAPDRETCLIRRAKTNTPLQALVLLNDPTYVEAARKFAERVLQHEQTPSSRLNLAYELAVCRPPRDAEQMVLLKMVKDARAQFAKNPPSAEKLLAVGKSPRDAKLDAVELAAWTTVTSMILNLDETISKR